MTSFSAFTQKKKKTAEDDESKVDDAVKGEANVSAVIESDLGTSGNRWLSAGQKLDCASSDSTQSFLLLPAPPSPPFISHPGIFPATFVLHPLQDVCATHHHPKLL